MLGDGAAVPIIEENRGTMTFPFIFSSEGLCFIDGCIGITYATGVKSRLCFFCMHGRVVENMRDRGECSFGGRLFLRTFLPLRFTNK
jgi:hypothetical protein